MKPYSSEDSKEHKGSREKPEKSLRRKAMDLLARREHSYYELLSKLEERFPDLDRETLITPALDRLRQENLQSDSRFMESYVRFRRSKGHGPLKIEAELKQKGLASTEIRTFLYDEGIDWFEEARVQLLKKAGIHENLDSLDLKLKQKYHRLLQQRGFDHEHIKSAFK